MKMSVSRHFIVQMFLMRNSTEVRYESDRKNIHSNIALFFFFPQPQQTTTDSVLNFILRRFSLEHTWHNLLLFHLMTKAFCPYDYYRSYIPNLYSVSHLYTQVQSGPYVYMWRTRRYTVELYVYMCALTQVHWGHTCTCLAYTQVHSGALCVHVVCACNHFRCPGRHGRVSNL